MGSDFPTTPERWREVGGEICPICDGFKRGKPGSEAETIYCLCSTLDWIEKQRELVNGYEQTIEPAYLKDLVPYDLPETGAGANFKKLLAFIPTWIQDPKDWLLISGGPGTGKTHIMRAIKTALPELCLYLSASRLQQLGFNALDDGKMSDLHQILGNVPILLLDDWGLEHSTSFSTDTMAAIIDRRYGHPEEFVTVVTTNMSPGHLLNSLDTATNMATKRIASRMMDVQKGRIFILKQADFRLPTTQVKVGGL